MCGIAGFSLALKPRGDHSLLQRMGDEIAHRGPDAHGEYLDEHIGLCHRRLSIIDLSSAGNQPMTSSCGRYVIVFNGEIYNFLELRESLIQAGCAFRTRTDTEVLLESYRLYGPDCLPRLNGMFAFAIWDRVERRLFMARDRIGKKPLYYFHDGGNRLAFASEIKPLLLLYNAPPAIEPTALADYLKYLYIPAPQTIFKRIYKLPAAHWLQMDEGTEPVVKAYWDIDFSKRFVGSENDACGELLRLLQDSTNIRMISDVPLGSFLSGGIDSSAVVALMTRGSGSRVKTCSIGFDDRRHDETPYAREVAELFKTEHQEYFVRDHLADTVRVLPRFFDEPFADSSAVPTYHVSRLARQDVTVALAGDGGDENFGGYEKYRTEIIENRVRSWVPRPLLRGIGDVCTNFNHPLLRKAVTLSRGAANDPGLAFYATNTFISDADLESLFAPAVRSACADYDPSHHTTRYWDKVRDADHVTRMLYTDLKTYLPGDILVKVDRMSMAHSLEVRAPLLDYRVIELAASLPSSWKIRGTSKKYILKNSFTELLPESILHRRKHGFTVPLDSWFLTDLRELGEQFICNSEFMGEYFATDRLTTIWREHQEQKRKHGTLLWALLVFALWHQEYLGR